MKKKAKKEVSLWDLKFNLIHSEKLEKLDPAKLAPRKLEEANKALSKIKKFPPDDY